MLSSIYSKLRGDVSGVKNEDSAQVGPWTGHRQTGRPLFCSCNFACLANLYFTSFRIHQHSASGVIL